MNFVEWCGVVLNRLAEATRVSTVHRVKGFTPQEIVGVVFGEDVLSSPHYLGSTQEKGLKQALGLLGQRQLLHGTGSLTKPSQSSRLSSRGRNGAQELERGWEWTLLEELDDEKIGLLRVLNTRSEHQADNHAWLESVPESALAEALGWDGDLELVKIVANDMSDFRGSGLVSVAYKGAEGPVRQSTYDGLVWSSRPNAPRPLTKLFETALTPRSDGDPAVDIDERDFGFVEVPGLREVLARDYREAQLCLATGAFKGAALLASGVIEGLLLDAMRKPELRESPDYERLTKGIRKRVEAGIEVLVWDRVGLIELLNLAEGFGLLNENSRRMIEGVRDYRDTVHPNAEVRLGSRADQADAELLLALAKFVYVRLSRNASP